MKMKMAAALSAVVAAALLSGCSGTATPAASGSASAGTSGQKLRIALVMSHLTNSFTTTFSEAAKAEAVKQGVDLTVLDAKKDATTQVGLIETAVTQQYDGIMVEPASVDGVKPAFETAKKADIPIMAVVQKLSDQSLSASYVGGDDLAAGRLEMEKAVEAIGGKGNIAILYGPMGSDAQLVRKKGYDEVLAKNPDVKVVFEQSANWVTDEALKITENWLQTGKTINAVVAQNDGMAVGAAKAVSDAQLTDKVIVTGVDATPEGLAAIKAGQMVGTVSQDTAGMGVLSVQTMIKVIKKEKVDAEYKTTPQWVNKDNAAQFK